MNIHETWWHIRAETVPTYVYMIYGGGLLKIGMARDVIRRLDTLQNTSPNRLQLIWCAFGNRDCERRLHEIFAADRRHGEWFEVSDSIRDFLAWQDRLPRHQAAIAAGTLTPFAEVLEACEAGYSAPAYREAEEHGTRVIVHKCLGRMG